MPPEAAIQKWKKPAWRARIAQLLRFGAVGVTCLGLSAAVLVGLHALARINYLLAYVASFVTGNITGYLLNARFTFAVRTVSRLGAARYMLVNALLLGVNTSALDFLVERMHMWYLAAAVLLGVLNTPVSFLAQRFVTYRTSVRRGAQNI